ncbi:OmpA family protein [Hyphomicrobium sp. LHD-15]|uniref:OmpA family protein n=1 Tax=Hyphomicrobium sp. LHD-15 TaxID=3072142 RepID=UPI0028109B30|nr:OmpA family protein [Hyphomicrobium sp. LHD-15]MDQ8700517.1 OmpA family protein [Hyphomicrobium sp. LHD-15]
MIQTEVAMLQRAALGLLLLIISGVAAIFAAAHFGVPLPWLIAERTQQEEPASTSNKRDQAADQPRKDTPEAVINETAAALGAGTPDAAKPAAGGVELDISRISPDGSSVFAGRAAPDSYVTILENGKPAGTAKADSYGEWSIVTEHKFAGTDPKLSFEASATPPAEPAAAPKSQVAAVDPQAGAAARSAAAVAGEALKKFETIVSEAREEAQKNERAQEKQAQTETSPPAAPATADVSSASNATTANTASGLSATESNATGTGKTTVIPVPIMFVYNEATLTSEGKHAADLLLEYLTLKRLGAVELTGHADERGTNQYNFDLSRERLDTVSQILRQGGYAGELKLTPKGKTEPYEGVNRTAYKGEALYQLDRRVELRVTQ